MNKYSQVIPDAMNMCNQLLHTLIEPKSVDM